MDIFAIINVVTTQRRRYYINLLMNIFAIINVSNTQQRWYCDIFSMRGLYIINALMVQLGTSCVLIARGWRGTSLPRVNVRKEIQRHRC